MEGPSEIEMFLEKFFRSWEEVEDNGDAPAWLPGNISEAGEYRGHRSTSIQGTLKQRYRVPEERKSVYLSVPRTPQDSRGHVPGERTPLAHEDFYRTHSSSLPQPQVI